MPEPVPGTLAEALAQLQGQLPRVAKTADAQYGKYADLTVVSEAILPLLSSLGLSFVCGPTLDSEGRFVLRYTLRHVADKDYVMGDYPLPTSGSPQQVGAAITYARRYALCAVTGLAPGGDDDDAQSAEQAHGDAHSPAQLPRTGTNASLRQQGRMDRQQKAEHEAQTAETLRGGKVERSHPRGPDPDDPWAQDAPVDHQCAAALREDAEDKPGSMIPGQHRAIEMMLGKLGIASTARGERHDYVATLLDLDALATFDDLSFSQAAKVLRLLQDELAKEKVKADA